jgi:tRNA 2-selenouridine synthase
LGQIGFKVNLIEGGYKAFRAAIVEDIPKRVAPLQFKVISGPTGSGKTRLLHALAAEGAQVLDLEDLACHRSSVLGHIPGQPQPSQKRFDTLVWQALRSFDPTRPVFVESESRKVGNLSIPESLMLAMRDSPCFELQLSLEERVALLMEDYNFFVDDQDLFCRRLDALVAIRGKAVVDAWKEQVHSGHIEHVVRDLLVLHYDPTYASSMLRNFTQTGQATACVAADRHPVSLRQVAKVLCQQVGA